MSDKEKRIKELWEKLQQEKFSPVIAFPDHSKNKWKLDVLEGVHTRYTTLQDNAEFILSTKEWTARILLPKNSIIETKSVNSQMIIDFVNVKPLDVVIDYN